MLLLLLALTAHADSEAGRVLSLVQADRVDKAVRLCDKLGRGGFEWPDERDACGRAHLDLLQERGDPDLLELDRHWTEWEGTPAARESRELAADMRLHAAVRALDDLDVDALQRLARTYGDTRAGADAVEVLWKHTLDQDSSAATERFIDDFPDSSLVPRARRHLQEQVWEEAAATASREGWRAFLARWPDHPRADEARRWEAALAFQEVEAVDTASAWGEFIADYPRHPRLDEAQRLYVGALFREAEDAGDHARLMELSLEHRDYPRAKLVYQEALLAQVQVRARVAGELSEPDVDGTLSVSAGPAEALVVSWPESPARLPLSLAIERDGRLDPPDEALAALLRLPRAEAVDRGRVAWTYLDDGTGAVATPAAPLCQPPGGVWVLVAEVAHASRQVRIELPSCD